MAHYAGAVPPDAGRISVEHLAALDEARDYNAASSYNWLKSELRRLREIVSGGGTLAVTHEGRSVVLASPAEFDAWAKQRYPSA